MKRVIVVVLFICACKDKAPPPDKPRPVLWVEVNARADGHRTFPGTVQPRYATQLAFRVNGRITKRFVSLGDKVKKGDVIATIDVIALTSSAMAAKANLEANDAKERNAQQTEARQAKLLASNSSTKSNAEDAQRSTVTASASTAEANARLFKAREDLSYGVLRADMDGVITTIAFEIEQTIAANQVIAEMARPDVLDVVVDVPEDIVGKLKIGNVATAYSADNQAVTVDGKIRQLSPSADQQSRTYRVWVAIPEPPPDVRLGSTVYATFASDFPPAIRVPVQAIVDEGERTSVWVIDHGVVKARPVTLADRAGRNAIVTEGLRDGEHVVIAGVHTLKDGQAVKDEDK
ncbi:MAG: efflux RND transporter periplasmic adaptor subunit [Clostridia bacterium]|nr:efflux RND transporter periplasmic adaptor subunit [Deltaproteobacteria bacterium]